MMFLLGRQAMFGHDPPMYLRSMTATRCPCPANVQAAMVEPVPPPRITRSNSSGCVFLGTWADEVFFVLFMRILLSERQVHSWLALISRGRPPTLLRATVRSQLLARCAPSAVECSARACCGASLPAPSSTARPIPAPDWAPYRSVQPRQPLPMRARYAPQRLWGQQERLRSCCSSAIT